MAQKITQALIYQEVIALKETLDNHSKQDNNNFRELRQILEGSESAPGMKIRVDRIEQLDIARKRQFSYVWSAILALLGTVATLMFQ